MVRKLLALHSATAANASGDELKPSAIEGRRSDSLWPSKRAGRRGAGSDSRCRCTIYSEHTAARRHQTASGSRSAKPEGQTAIAGPE